MKGALQFLLTFCFIVYIRASPIDWDAINGDPIHEVKPVPTYYPVPENEKPITPLVVWEPSPYKNTHVAVIVVNDDNLVPPMHGIGQHRPFEPKPSKPLVPGPPEVNVDHPIEPPMAPMVPGPPEVTNNRPMAPPVGPGSTEVTNDHPIIPPMGPRPPETTNDQPIAPPIKPVVPGPSEDTVDQPMPPVIPPIVSDANDGHVDVAARPPDMIDGIILPTPRYPDRNLPGNLV